MLESQPTVTVRELAPLLMVDDIALSAAFYREKLGFELVEQWSPDGKLAWCRLQRDGAAVMLQQSCDEDAPAADRGRGVEFFFLCNDANVIHAELQANGLDLDSPQVAFYGMNQLFLRDPDGYRLCFQNLVEPS